MDKLVKIAPNPTGTLRSPIADPAFARRAAARGKRSVRDPFAALAQLYGLLGECPANQVGPWEPPSAGAAGRARTWPPPVLGGEDIVVNVASRSAPGRAYRYLSDAVGFAPGPWGPAPRLGATVIAPRQGFGCAAMIAAAILPCPAPEWAARWTIEELRAAAPDGRWPEGAVPCSMAMGTASETAHRRLVTAGEDSPCLRGLAASATCAAITGATLVVGHVGHTSAWLVRAGAIEALTKRHCPADDLLRGGPIPELNLTVSLPSRSPSRAIGRRIELDVSERRLHAGDRLLLASSGLTDTVPRAELAAVVASESDPGSACERLIHLATRRAARHDATAVVLHVEGAGLR